MLTWWFSRPLWQKIVAAFILGIIAGVVFGEGTAIWAKPIGDLYVNLMRMLVVPLVFFTVTSSISRFSEGPHLVRLGLRTFLWFLITSVLAVIVGLTVASFINPGANLSSLALQNFTPRTIPSFLDVIVSIIPVNPLKAMVETNVLQVLFFAALVGIALAKLSEKTDTVRTFINQSTEVVFYITRIVLLFTPLGTFGLIAWIVGQHGLLSLLPLGKFIIAIYVACIIHIFFVYGSLVKIHGFSVQQFFREIMPAQIFAFVSSSSLLTLPLSMRILVTRLKVPESYASFSLPLGVNLKMDGCGAIYPAVASVFIAQYFKIDLTMSQYFIIALTAVLGSFATVGVPGTSVVMLTLTLNAAGLPLEGIGYIVAIDRIIDMIRTTTNVTGQIVVPFIVAKREKILEENQVSLPTMQPIDT